MFNLEQSIANWRRQMLAAGIKAPVPLEELESHLREEIERQMKSGMNAQQAFEMTVSQIGQAKELKMEFAKDRRLMNFLEIELIKKEWDLKWGPVLHIVTFSGTGVFFAAMVLFKKAGFSEITSFERMSCLAAAVLSYLLSNSGLLGYRFLPSISNSHVRLAIYACSAMLVSGWLMIFLMIANLDIHQFATEFSWAFFVPLGAFIGLVSGFERAAHKKIRTAGS